jgi:broad specificity phosphatase PhoE
MKSLKTIYLIRHGQPLLDTRLNYKVVPGPGLAQVGREQAHETGMFLAESGIELLFSSPLERARQTAQCISNVIGVPVTLNDYLREFDDPAENKTQLQARLHTFLSQLISYTTAQNISTIALVSHGSPLKELLSILGEGLVDLTPYETTHGNPVTPAGVWRAIANEARWHLELVFVPQSGDWDQYKNPLFVGKALNYN